MRRNPLLIARNGVGLGLLGCSIALRTEVAGDGDSLSESGADAITADDGSNGADGSLDDANVGTSVGDDAPAPDTTPSPPIGSCASKVPYLFCDDFENGILQWTPTNSPDVTCKAAPLAVGPNGGPTNVLAIDVDGKNGGYLSRTVQIPVTSTQVEIQFRFRYDSFINVGEDLFFATILSYSGGGGGRDDGYSFYLNRTILRTGLWRFKVEDNKNNQLLSTPVGDMNWYELSLVIVKATGAYTTKLVVGGNSQIVDTGTFKNGDKLARLDLRLGYTGPDNKNKKASLSVDEVVVR